MDNPNLIEVYKVLGEALYKAVEEWKKKDRGNGVVEFTVDAGRDGFVWVRLS